MAKSRKEYDKKYEEKRVGTRTRNWTVIFYPEDLPEDWQAQVDELRIKWIEGPVHDKDWNTDGTPKKAHVHTLFMFENVKNAEQVTEVFSGLFGTSESGSIVGVAHINEKSRAGDRCGVVRYMAHMDNPEKAQYDPNEIKGHNGADPAEILRYSATETREMIVAIEEFIEENGITNLLTFSNMIRYEHPEWHTLVSTKMTFWFNSIINANYQRIYGHPVRTDYVVPQVVDADTGEIKE